VLFLQALLGVGRHVGALLGHLELARLLDVLEHLLARDRRVGRVVLQRLPEFGRQTPVAHAEVLHCNVLLLQV